MAIVSNTQNDSNLRDLWIFLCGHAYSSAATCKEVTDLTPNREFMPLDVRMLLEGIETRDATKVAQWFISRGATLSKDIKAPRAAADTIASHFRNKLFEQATGSLDFIRHLSPDEALAKLKELTASLEGAGIKPRQPDSKPKEPAK